MSLDEVFEETAIDPWFLAQIEQLVAASSRRWPAARSPACRAPSCAS